MTAVRRFNRSSPSPSAHSEMLREEPPLLADEPPVGDVNNNPNHNLNHNGVHYEYSNDPLQVQGIDGGVSKHRLNDLCAALFSRETESDVKTHDSTHSHPHPHTMDNLGPTASSTFDSNETPESTFQVLQVGNNDPEMKQSHARTKTHATTHLSFRPSSRQLDGEMPAVSSTSRGERHHYAHLSPPPMYHPWPPQPFMYVNGGHPMPPPHHQHHPYPFHHHPDAYSSMSMYDPPMECEVYDVDNDVVVTEQQQSPNRVSPARKTGPSFMSGGFANGYYPSSAEFEPSMVSPYQQPLPAKPPSMPTDSINQVPKGLKTAATSAGTHHPVLIQTGLGPALLLHPSAMAGPVPMALPRPTDNRTGTSPASSVDGSSPTRNSTNSTKKPSSAPKAAEVEVMDTRFQRWTEAEDQLLTKAAKEQGGPPYNWNRIAAKCFPATRTGPQCKARWKKALKPGLKRGNWEPEEDRLILELHEEGLRWTEIAERIPGRVPDHIRQRFMNALDPEKKKTPWTQQENQILYQAQKRLGNKWSEISKLLPGRSENDIKNRWHNAKMAQRRKMRRIAKESARRTVVSKTAAVVQPPVLSGASLDGSSESQEVLQVDDDVDSIGSLV